MLSFLKKSGRKKQQLKSLISDFESSEKIDQDFDISDAEKFILERNESLELESQPKLSRNLSDILINKTCLCYFVQYLEELRQGLAYVKFWLDVENYRTAASEEHSNIKSKHPTPTNEVFSESYSPSINSTHFKYEAGEEVPNDRISSTGHQRLLSKSVSSDGYDSLSYSSFDCDSISNNFTEHDVENTSTASSDGQEVPETNGTRWQTSLTDDEKSSKIRERKTSKFHSSISTDAIRIYRKYLVTNSVYYIEIIPADILSNISLSFGLSSDNDTSSTIISSMTSTCFDEAQNYVHEHLEKEFVQDFLASILYLKYTVDVLTNEKVRMNDILNNEELLFYFMEFLEQFDKRIYLDFILTAVNFKVNNVKNFNYTQAQSDAMIIYEKYFSLQATNSLELSNVIRGLVEENICKEEKGDLIVNCFDPPVKVVEYFLNQKYFRAFMKSNLYYKYLKDLFNRIYSHDNQNKRDSGVKSSPVKKNLHRKTFSDCTNDNSKFIRTTQNTLLAGSSNLSSNTSNKCLFAIDSRHFYNPDLLWQRKTDATKIPSSSVQSVMSLGRITEIGRYERNFDMANQDEGWGGNRIKNVVKKLVKLPEDKAQEELAWSIAEMIVKDITNITLNKDNCLKPTKISTIGLSKRRYSNSSNDNFEKRT